MPGTPDAPPLPEDLAISERHDDEPQSFVQGVGCALVLMGTVAGVFGAAALLGVSDRIELHFFGIQADDTRGRLVWTAGCVAAVWIGWRILQVHGRGRRG